MSLLEDALAPAIEASEGGSAFSLYRESSLSVTDIEGCYISDVFRGLFFYKK